MFMSQKSVTYAVPSSIVYERKFDTAIRKSQIENFISRKEKNIPTYDDRLILESKLYNKDFPLRSNPDCYARILDILIHRTDQQGLSNLIQTDLKMTSFLPRIYDLVIQNLKIQVGYMHGNNHLPNKKTFMQQFSSYIDNIEVDIQISNLLHMATWLGTLIEESNNVNDPKYRDNDAKIRLENLLRVNHKTHKELEITFVWSNKLVLINVQQKQYILPKPYILLCHNKICDLISVLLLAQYTEGASNPHNSRNLILEFLEEMTRIMFEFQEDYFEIAKTLEALCIAETLIDVEKWKNKDFLNVITEELRSTVGFDYEISPLSGILRTVDIPFRHELVCLSKILGHPLVDMKAGAEKIHSKATEVYNLNATLLIECECYIKENYVRNAIIKNRTWPPHVISSALAPIPLIQAAKKNLDPYSYEITKNYGRINITDWEYVDILPNMKFNKLENSIPYLKDKTISICRSGVFSTYLAQANTRPKTMWKDTRLLLVYLLNPLYITDHVSYIENYDSSDDLDNLLDYLAIRIVPKEKEMKIKFRGFGCKSYHERFRALAQEKNVMKFLEEYSDEQAMTLSELELTRRLYSFRKLKDAYRLHHVLLINLDASNWNNHFRPETVDNLMVNTLDRIFNTRIFQKTQTSFEKTLFYVPDENEVYYWEGQGGGIEGLNQDTWVVVYIAQIKTALSHMDVKYHILCKGDDFRLALIIPNRDVDIRTISKRKTEVVKTLSRIAQELGHTIKIEDSYGSERYFTFSKTASVDMIELPQTFRKIQKCYGANNAFLPCLDDYIASTFSNAHSSAKTSPTIIGNYAVALSWSYYYLLTDPAYATLGNMQLTSLLLVPSMVGGFPIIYLHNMYVRAESDLLSPFLGLCIYCKNLYPQVFEYMISFCNVSAEVPTTYIGIYKDPYCLPINRPSLPSTILRNLIVPSLSKIVKNETILELLDAINAEESQLCIDAMDSCNVLMAKPLSTIYSALPVGILDELLRKFESARSINELIIIRWGKRKADKYLRTIILAEKKLQTWRINICRKGYEDDSRSFVHFIEGCPAEAAHKVREYAWGKVVDGITMPPLQHQVVFTTQSLSRDNGWHLRNHFTYNVHLPTEFLTPDKRYQYASAGCRPFIGFTTRTGSVEPLIHFVDKDVILTKVKNLLEIASWTDQTATINGIEHVSNIRLLIERVVMLYTNVPLKKLQPFTGSKKSGTMFHHVRSKSFRESIIPNCLSNIYQMVVGESNTHLQLRNSMYHYKVNFLHIYCYAVTMIMQELEVTTCITTPEVVWAVTSSCTFCNTPIQEMPLIINAKSVRNINFSILKATQVSETSDQTLRESLGLFNQRTFNIEGNLINLTALQATYGLFQELMESTSIRRKMLQDRYTSHTINREAQSILSNFIPRNKSREVGTTELKRMTNLDLSVCMIHIVFNEVYRMLPRVQPDRLLNQLISIPADELPWTSLLQQIHNAGRLAGLIRELCKATNHPLYSCYATPIQAAHIVGQLSVEAFLLSDYETELVIVSNYGDNQLKSHIRQALSGVIWRLIFKSIEWCNEEDVPKYDMVCEAIMILMLQLNRDDNIKPFNHITVSCRKPLTELCLFDEDGIHPDNCTDREWIKERAGPLLSYILRLTDSNLTEIIENFTTNYDVIFESVLSKCERCMLSITVTTLSDCISKVRSIPPVPLVNLHEELPEINIKGMLGYLTPLKHDTQYVTKVPPYHDTLQNAIPDQMVAGLGQTDAVYPSQQYLYRPYGYTNCSPSSIIEVLQIFKANPLGPTHLHIACLGDGYGSCTALMAQVHHSSIILYDTLPQDKNVETRPEPAIMDQEETECQFIYDHHLAGTYDLCDSMTLRCFEEQLTNISVMICDAELPVIDTYLFIDILFNAFRYYVRNRTEHAYGIIRLYIENITTSLSLLSEISKYCTHVYLFTPKSIRCYRLAYVIFWGKRSNEISNYDDPHPLVVNDSIKRAFMVHVDKALTRTTEEREIIRRQLILSQSIGYQGYWRLKSEPLWIGLAERHLGLAIPSDYLSDICSKYNVRNVQDVVKRINISYDVQTRDFQNFILRDKQFLHIGQKYDIDNHAHRIYIIKRWVRVYGFFFIFTHIREQGLEPIDLKTIKRHFLCFCRNLPMRDYDQNYKYPDLYKRKTLSPKGQDVSYYHNYLNGINIALSLVAHITASTDIYDQTAIERRRLEDVQ